MRVRVFVVDADFKGVSIYLPCPVCRFEHPHSGSAAAYNGHGDAFVVPFGVVQGVVIDQMIAQQCDLIDAVQFYMAVAAFGVENVFQKTHICAAFYEGIDDNVRFFATAVLGNQALSQSHIAIFYIGKQVELVHPFAVADF